MSDDGNKADADLNELLGSDSDGELEITENVEVKESQGAKASNNEIADLLGDSDDDDDAVQPSKKDDQRTMDEYYPKSENNESRADDLEQILGKVEIRLGAKEVKTKTQSKIAMHPTYKVPPKHSTLFVRTPNFIKIQPTEYEEPLYEADSERQLFDGSTAVVRWRTKRDSNGEIMLGADGKPIRESNARMLRWSDGTAQLVVGDAVFQCKNLDVDNWYARVCTCVAILNTIYQYTLLTVP
jgi:RNA polymerase-associated protein LEO1